MTSTGPLLPGPVHVAIPLLAVASLLVGGSVAEAQTLQGSAASLDRQNYQAQAHDFSYLRTPQEVRNFVESGYLVPVTPNRDFTLHQVSFPYARPEVRLFIERLAAQYRSACGEQLVVTSLTRPISNQPPNASSRSVHPTGMALDLRRPANARCRQWLESTLLSLEGRGVVEAIYERNPPHYHVAVFPQPYAQYVAQVVGDPAAVARTVASATAVEARWITHTVARGENLSTIATRYGAAVSRIRSENGLSGDRILVGQRLRIPVYEPAASVPQVAQASTPAPAPAPPPIQAAPVPEAVAVASTPATVHVVGRGESLWTIARRYGVTEDDLRRANGVSGSRILAGQRLTVPGTGGAGSGSGADHVVHRVAQGESLWTIARAYGVSEGVIRAANGIQGSRILAGQELLVPAGGAGGAVTMQYTVQNGDSLWVIANRLGASVDEIRNRNGMSGSQIHPGQVLDVPLAR